MIKIHPIQTGVVQVKRAQKRRRLGGLLRTLTDQDWSEWLPIYAWLIEHPEGLFLVDTGETARTKEADYFPSWHPYFRWAMKTRVELDEEVGPQLRSIGVEPEEIDTVIMTHLHTDHAGGIRYFPGSRFLVSPDELGRAGGFLGKLRGYLPDHWPEWFRPDDPAEGVVRKIGPFYPCHSVTTDGAIAILPTEGHTPHHISVLVSTPEMRYLLAGDASYSQVALLNQRPDGVSPAPFAAKRTLRQILALASSKPMVYLPSHDPEAVERLENREPIPGAQAAGALLTGHAGGQRELATVIRGS
ncbi:MAG: N-acyl homoserine lactonase family protein [Gemmatimonadota bacterium]|jgi:glyoxylase-like metal-dependent hydrolase (beta-lactamase superfamily II)